MRPPVRETTADAHRFITDDMPHTGLRHRANAEPFEDIRLDLIIPTGKRKGLNPSLASTYRALNEHEKRQAHTEAVDQAHTDFTTLHPSTRHG